MTRKVNAATLSHIKQSEGLRLTAYPDPGSKNGIPYTIGYGSTSGVKKGDKITEAEAERLLVRDLTYAENTVERLVKVPLNDNQFGALVSFVFNIGAGAFEDSTLLRRLNAGDYVSVPAQLARWNKNDGSVMAGLTKRRAAETALWLSPVVSAPPQPEISHYPEQPPTPAAAPEWPGKIVFGVLIAIGVIALALYIITRS